MAKKKLNKKQKEIVEIKLLTTYQSYKELMIPLETKITNEIENYVNNNKLTYTANSPEFIKGLQLGLKVGTETLYESIRGNSLVKNENPNQLDFFEVIKAN